MVQRDLGEGIRAAKQRLTAEHIFVVKGEYDSIQDILDSYGSLYIQYCQRKGLPPGNMVFERG